MKRLICFALILTSLFCLLAVSASAELYSGKALDSDYIMNNEGSDHLVGEFGDNEDIEEAYELAKFYQLQYELDTDSGELRIYTGSRGMQAMLPYARSTWIPWLKTTEPDVMRPFIRTAVIEEGVLSVGRYSFYQCENLREVYLPASIMKIDRTSFYEVPSLETVFYAGNQEDFERNVTLDKVRNDEMLNKIHYGESVNVICKNQHGEIFDSYTVGGYFVGDSFTVSARTYENITLDAGQKDETGTFVKNDAREYVYTYECQHSYALEDESIACKSRCVHCGHMNPDVYDLHEFEVTTDEKGGLFKSMKMSRTCTSCGYAESFTEPAYILYVGVALGGLVAAVGIFLAIFLPIRRKKKIKEMTW